MELSSELPLFSFSRRLETRLDTVEAVLQDVFEYAQLKARYLSNTLGCDSEYFLSLIFDRGAFLHPMSRHSTRDFLGSANRDPDTISDDVKLTDLRKEFIQEFDSLTSKNQLVLSNFLKDYNHESPLAIRSAPSDRAADVDMMIDIMRGLFLLLKCRCGIDGFFCLARNNKAYELRPDSEWFYTDPNINACLTYALDGWDMTSITSQLEKFGLHTAPPRYATWMRKEIEKYVNVLLARATGRRNISMDYENYEKAVLIDLGVALVRWTHPAFVHPSILPPEICPLETLLRALHAGKCYFCRITEAERARRLRDYMRRIAMGQPACSTSMSHPSADTNSDGAESGN